ncbi:MAG TPA: hypothetical protein VH619_06875, partial [Verrucomicrobiae bacterium]|nr:hypothetical protein [Verrucomicrobiae bacterium]
NRTSPTSVDTATFVPSSEHAVAQVSWVDWLFVVQLNPEFVEMNRPPLFPENILLPSAECAMQYQFPSGKKLVIQVAPELVETTNRGPWIPAIILVPSAEHATAP